MKTIAKSVSPACTAIALTCLAFSLGARAETPGPSKVDIATRARVNESYGKLPLSFEANQGQQDQPVKFLSRGSGYNLFLTKREAVLVLTKSEKPAAAKKKAAHAKFTQKKPQRQSTVLRTQLVAANPAAKVSGEEELAGKINYLIGKDPAKWRTGVATYAKVRYEQVYPGIDLVYYGNQRQLEYDFVVGPGADPARIRLKLAGARKMYVDGQGELVVQTAGGGVRWNRPEIYQEVDGQHRSVQGKYVLRAGHELGFAVAAYETARPLIIDPTLVYSTFLAGRYGAEGWGIAVDTSGNAYVTGFTYSNDFPTTAGAFQRTYHGGADAFVTEFNPTGTGLVYSTYLGGSDLDGGDGIAVDTSGNAYVTGTTDSSDFPTTAGAFQRTYRGDEDAFVTELNPTGTGLVYSTYLGSSGSDGGAGIAVDSSGHAYVAGFAGSSDFPTTAGAFQTTFAGGLSDGFVTELNPTGTGLVYSTYLGGSDRDLANRIAVDTSGNAYVIGLAESSDFPTTAGAFQTNYGGEGDAFVTELDPTGTGLVYSTYLGGSGGDDGIGIAVDTSGDAYLTGFTVSSDFPTTIGAFQTTFGGGPADVFITELNPTGTGLVYSTYLGGSDSDVGEGIAVDTSGNAYVTGDTYSSDFPTTAGAFQTTFGGVTDGFVTELNPTGTGLVYSTYLGGSDQDVADCIAVDTSGNAYITGYTYSRDFPTTAGAFQRTFEDVDDAFVAKFSMGSPPPFVLTAARHVVNRTKVVRLTWRGATSDYIYVDRNGHKIAEIPNRVGLFTDTLTSTGVYTYAVREVGGLQRVSNKVKVKFGVP